MSISDLRSRASGAKNRVNAFQPKRLTQARLAQGLSMAELANCIGVSRQAISSFEKGDKVPAYDTLQQLKNRLKVNETFFFLSSSEQGIKADSAINYRTLRSTTAKEAGRVETFLEWFAEFSNVIGEQYVDFQPINVPEFDIADFEALTEDDVDGYAEKTRRFFGLGDGPISNLTLLLENHGIFVGYLPLPSKTDGISVWYNRRPYVLINRSAYACRARFDLAHELGHLVLHRALDQADLDDRRILDLVEKQAHQFAGSFLVPEKAIAKEFYSMDLNALRDLKRRWGVSMQALVMILCRIGLVSDSQKRYFFQKISAMGFRKKEPLDDVLKREESVTFKRILEMLAANSILTGSDLLASMPIPIVQEISGLGEDFFLDKEMMGNVIQFKPKL